jgi:Zn-dependent protease
MSTGFLILLNAPPLILAVVLHEIAHGWVAEKLGDPTARKLGRINLNPLVHIDPILTLLLPAVLIFSGSPIIFGGAKPVPVNPGYFKNPRRGMALVALAGPVLNFILAGCSFAILFAYLELFGTEQSGNLISNLIPAWLAISIIINLILGFFNLLPIPPLDGGRIAVGYLPIRFAKFIAKLEPYGFLIVVLLLLSGVVDKFLQPIIKLSEYLLKIAVGA